MIENYLRIFKEDMTAPKRENAENQDSYPKLSGTLNHLTTFDDQTVEIMPGLCNILRYSLSWRPGYDPRALSRAPVPACYPLGTENKVWKDS